jgi:hypothetical protein
MLWLSQVHWSSGGATNTERTRIFEFYYCFKLCFTWLQAVLFLMDSGKPKLKEIWKDRFGSIIFLLRLGGIPFKMKNLSTKYSIYMTTGIICSCALIVGMFADVYVHWDNLGRAMTNLRVLIPTTDIFWLYTCCRWVRTVANTVRASRYD